MLSYGRASLTQAGVQGCYEPVYDTYAAHCVT